MNSNLSIAPSSAWSRLLQVQCFGQRYVEASGNTVGTINILANEIPRFSTELDYTLGPVALRAVTIP